MTTAIRDYTPVLRDAIVQARAAGFAAEASALEWACSATFTTSSEMCQAHGLAIRRFLTATRGRLPRPIGARLSACLRETELAGTGWRRLLATLRRRRMLG